MIDRKYPVGTLAFQDQYTSEDLKQLSEIIDSAPLQYRQLVADLSDDDLLKTYREGSWNIRQLVHHVADIAFLHYFRMKKIITEPESEMALINIDAWAHTADSLEAPIDSSLRMLESVTARYLAFMATLSSDDLDKSYYHSVRKIWITQRMAIAMSAWHIRHHLAHIKLALGILE